MAIIEDHKPTVLNIQLKWLTIISGIIHTQTNQSFSSVNFGIIFIWQSRNKIVFH